MDYQGGQLRDGDPLALSDRARVTPCACPTATSRASRSRVELLLPDSDTLVVVNVHFDWVADDTFRFAQATALHALPRLAAPALRSCSATSTTSRARARSRSSRRAPREVPKPAERPLHLLLHGAGEGDRLHLPRTGPRVGGWTVASSGGTNPWPPIIGPSCAAPAQRHSLTEKQRTPGQQVAGRPFRAEWRSATRQPIISDAPPAGARPPARPCACASPHPAVARCRRRCCRACSWPGSWPASPP